MRIIITIIICCGFALGNDLNNEPGIADTLKPRHSQRTIIAAEFTGGFFGGLIGGAALGYSSAIVSAKNGDPWHEFFEAFGVFLIGATIGYTAGSAVGTYWAGSSLKQNGTFLPTLTGALLGVPISWGLIWAAIEMEKSEALFLIPAFAIPPIGAVIGYNLSRPKSSKQQTLFHHLNFPTLGLRTEKSIEAKTITYLDFKLINAKF